jgi:hypothetical protein
MNPKDYHTFLTGSPHRGQRQVAEASARFKVVATGRRWGKGELARMLAHAYARHKGYRVLLVTGKPRTAYNALVPKQSHKYTGLQRREPFIIEYTDSTAGRIVILSPSAVKHLPDLQLDGAGVDYAILDEAAFMGADVWGYIQPALDKQQGGAIFLSTPFGRNWFYDLWQRGLAQNDTEWRSFHYPMSANPHLNTDDITRLREESNPNTARQEVDGQFVTMQSVTVMDKPLAHAVIDTSVPAYYPNHRYVMGVDSAAGQDFNAIAVMDATTKSLVAYDQTQHLSLAQMRARVLNLASVWQPSVIWMEKTGIGQVAIEQLQNEGLPVRPFLTTQQSRAALVESFVAGLSDQVLALPDDPLIRNALTRITLDLQSNRYSGINDLAMAMMLAWYGVVNHGIRVDFA